MSQQPFTAATFHAFLDDHKLMASRCQQCDGLFVPPRPLCPSCFSKDLTWEALSGAGELAAFTAVAIGPTAMVSAGYDRKHPYVSGIVKLAEGPMVSAQILGLDGTKPDAAAIGTPLTVAFITRGEGDSAETVLAFEA